MPFILARRFQSHVRGFAPFLKLMPQSSHIACTDCGSCDTVVSVIVPRMRSRLRKRHLPRWRLFVRWCLFPNTGIVSSHNGESMQYVDNARARLSARALRFRPPAANFTTSLSSFATLMMSLCSWCGTATASGKTQALYHESSSLVKF